MDSASKIQMAARPSKGAPHASATVLATAAQHTKAKLKPSRPRAQLTPVISMRFRDSQIPLADSEPRNSKAVTNVRSSVADEQMSVTKRAAERCFGPISPHTKLPKAGTARSRLKRGNAVGRLI